MELDYQVVRWQQAFWLHMVGIAVYFQDLSAEICYPLSPYYIIVYRVFDHLDI